MAGQRKTVKPIAGQDDDLSRCAICDWPLMETVKEGCVRGNCSMRPLPTNFYSAARARAENAQGIAHDLLAAEGSASGLSDFKTGWWRYWMTFALPWSSIAGFALAAVVSSFVADAVVETVKVVVGWNR